MKTYEEALEMIKEYAINMRGLMRAGMINSGTFAIIGHFIGGIYGVDDKQIIEDFVIEVNGITYKLIDIK